MLFPKDKPLHVNLDTSFVVFPALLEYLVARRFSGCLRMELGDFEGTLFFGAGEVLDCGVEEGAQRLSGAPAQAAMVERSRAHGGRIDTFNLSPDLVTLLGQLVGGEPIFRDLSTEFANPDRLLTKLKEQGHTGYIEVSLSEGRGEGVIFLRDGAYVEAVLQSESQTYSGLPVVESIVQGAANLGAVFNVYRAVPAGAVTQAPQPAPLAVAVPAAMAPPPPWAPVPATLDDSPGPLPAPLSTATLAPLAETGPAPTQLHMITPHPAFAAARQAEQTADNSDEVLAFWSEMLSKAEGAVDRLSSEGRFATAFKEVLVEKAASFPYLDPFAAEFDYRDGKVTFAGEPPADLPEALGDCLHDTIARLAFRLKRADLETRVRAELSEMYDQHASMIDRFSPSTQALVS